MSCTVRCSDAEKLAKLGTVNSAERKKPKWPRVQAAQNMQWSEHAMFKVCQITIMMLSVIGKWVEGDKPWDEGS